MLWFWSDTNKGTNALILGKSTILNLKKNREIMKVYVLFETDTHKSRQSRVFLGVFDSEIKAIDHAKENDCYTNVTEVVILECELNEFLEQ